MIPLQVICYASIPEITAKLVPMLKATFGEITTEPPAEESKQAAIRYAVCYESRSCDGLQLDRMELINAIAALIPKARFFVVGTANALMSEC